MVSVIILTKDEELDLPACLQALNWCNDIHVLDSNSTDRTQDIAREHGAGVWTHPFESFGKQRNYALDHLDIRYDWVLFLDADEIATDTFKSSVFKAINAADRNVAGYYCCWKMILEDKWLKRCDNFPKWQFRLLKKGKARFKDFGHGQKEDDVIGEILYLKEPYLHYGFSKGWSQWIERHNRYSSQEAKSRIISCPHFKDIFSGHGSVRNPALKSWLSKVPGWPFLRFFQSYFLNLGFLEGIPGLIYCTNMGFYEYLIQIKIREIRRKMQR